MIIPALSLAERPARRNLRPATRFITEYQKSWRSRRFGSGDELASLTNDTRAPALCIPVNDDADEICAAMLISFEKNGIAAVLGEFLTTEYGGA
jgi:hypothetical protein